MGYSRTFNRLGFAFALIALFLINGNSFAVQVEGFGVETVVKDYLLHGGIPLLQNFYLRFTSGDRHILGIDVYPGLPETDNITLKYFDESRDDEYQYKVAHQTRLPVTGVQTGYIYSVFSGKEVRSVSKPGPDYEFVIVAFSLGFSPAEDHHIDEVGIFEDDGEVTISFNDRNDDDVFIYHLVYAWVPKTLIQSMGVETGTNVQGGDKAPIPEGIPVIRGFRFDYEAGWFPWWGGDHHIQEIGVLTGSTVSGDLEVYYSDHNQDDDFDWEVRWAILKGPLTTAEIVGEIIGKFAGALARNDTLVLDGLLHDDLIFIGSDGAVISKTQWLEIIKSGVYTYGLYDDGSKNVRVFGNTAVVAGRATVTRSAEGKELPKQYRFTCVYVYNSGRWQVVAIQLTRLVE